MQLIGQQSDLGSEMDDKSEVSALSANALKEIED
jgi:hypothetical protein